MRISTITNWAYGATVLLTGLAGAAFITAADAADRERAAVEQHLALDSAAADLVQGTEALTDEARLFAMRGQSRHAEAYEREKAIDRTRERALDRVRRLDPSVEERRALATAEADFDELVRIEDAAVADVKAGRADQARITLFGPEHERAEAQVIGALQSFRALVTTRTEAEMQAARIESDRASLVAKGLLTTTALLFLAVLYFVLRRRVSVPLTRMTGIVTRLARQDFAVEVPLDRRRDEIGDMTQAIQVFRENGLERERLEAERRLDQRAKDCILQMTHRLQACQTRQELAEVVACFAPQTFPDLAGRLYVLDERRNALELMASWLDPQASEASFPPNVCWGVRRGRTHINDGQDGEIPCSHAGHAPGATLCVPLTAQGDTIGLLYFEELPAAEADARTPRIYLDLMSDNVSLALANQRLRERLASLAERDGLTGLFNRRRLDEMLKAAGFDEPLSCVMVDIDHFKRFNDAHGHDAGDAVMQHVAQILADTVGDAGSVYRFGGEEFTILLPGCAPAAAFEVAERARRSVAAATLAHHGRLLGQVTISLGVAVSPQDASVGSLLRAADAALLEAKAQGRDRTVAARPLSQEARPAA
ncbi:MAG: diguanylate cyclase [Pseudomonadota bacterium]